MTTQKNMFDPKFIDPFAQATKVTLETQIGFPTELLKPYVKAPQIKLQDVDIAGLINLTSPHFKGVIAVCFSTATFLNIYEKMLGERHKEITNDVKDAAGEIINIIFGQAKQTIAQKFGISLGMVIPTVLVGSNMEVVFKSDLPTIILPFKTDGGEFHLEIIVDSSSVAVAA